MFRLMLPGGILSNYSVKKELRRAHILGACFLLSQADVPVLTLMPYCLQAA